MIDIVNQIPEDEYSYSFNYLKEQIEKAENEEKLEKLNEDLASDYEAGNINENEFRLLSCYLDDKICDLVGNMLDM